MCSGNRKPSSEREKERENEEKRERMEFARMDSLSRLFPSDLEFQSGRISFRFCSRSKFKSKRQSILIDITLLARYPSILILLSPLPSFVSGNFRGKSNSTHFFFFDDQREEKKMSKRIEINRTLFPNVDGNICSLVLLHNRPMTFSRPGS